MPPKELLALIQRMRGKGATRDEIEEVVQENGFVAENDLRMQVQYEEKKARSSALSMSNVGRAMVQGATFNGAGKLGLVDEGAAQDFASANPGMNFASEMAGAVVPSLLTGGAADAVVAGRLGMQGMGRVAAGGMLAGAAEGAAYGGINAPDGERMGSAGMGALIGGTAGALAPGMLHAGRHLLIPSVRANNRVRAAVNQTSGGRDAVLGFVDDAERAGRGDIVRLGDASPRLRQELDFAANSNPDAREQVMNALFTRKSGRPERSLQDLESQFGNPLPSRTADVGEMKESLRQWAAKYYGTMRSGNDLLATDDALLNILTRPQVQDAYRAAQSTPLIREGFGPQALTVSQLSQTRGRLRGLSGRAYTAGDGEMGSALKDAGSQLEAWISARVPEYESLNRAYAAHQEVIRAYEGASDWWIKADRGVMEQAMANIAKMKDPEMRRNATEAARRGAASRLVEMLDGMSENAPGTLDRLVKPNPLMKKKLRVLFGSDDRVEAYMQRVRIERELSYSEGALGGSQTAMRGANADYVPESGVAGSVMRGDVGGAAMNAMSAMTGRGMRQGTAKAITPTLLTEGAGPIRRKIDDLFPNTLRPGSGILGGAAGGLAARTLLDQLTSRRTQ